MTKAVQFLMLRGLPGSGKSTYAAELVKHGWKRLNKDMMRDMIDGGEFSPENEAALNHLLYTMAEVYLQMGYNVVSDNMNFNPWHFRQAQSVVVNVNSFYENEVRVTLAALDFHTDIGTCIERDAKRPKPVTEEVIRKIAAQWNIAPDFPDISPYCTPEKKF